MTISRRGFLGGACAALGGAAADAFGACGRSAPLLTFGVVSDVHIGGKADAVTTLESVLRWFASMNVDAVLCPGDIAHSGLIGDLEKFATAWYTVFPGGRGPDGRTVELMISTGNHDIDAWSGRWNGYTEEQLQANCFNYGDNPSRVWNRLFGQQWELVWRRQVKGFTFVGAQWSSLNPPLEAYMRDHAAEFAGDRPFFFCQHAHPKGTCHGSYSMGDDDGTSVRALSPFPNAVAITGHSHCAISDERTVWQGAFTSIGAGCMHEGAGGFDYDNVTAYWHSSYRTKLMASMADPLAWGGDASGGACELVEVFDGHLVVHRQSVKFGMPIASPCIVPLPARGGGPMDFSRRTAGRPPPEFAAGAQVTAEYCPHGHELEGVGHQGEACVHLSFPRARTVRGSRVFDYRVEAIVEGGAAVVRPLIAAGFAYPEERADIPGECLFSTSEVPAGRSVRFTVTPRNCFGVAGRSISGTFTYSA